MAEASAGTLSGLLLDGSFYRIVICAAKMASNLDLHNLRGRREEAGSSSAVAELAHPGTPGGLSLVRVRSRSGILHYLLSRGQSLTDEIRRYDAPSDEDILNAAYWNDCLLVFFDEAGSSWNVCSNRSSSLPVFWRKQDLTYIIANRVVPDLKQDADDFQVDAVGWAEALLLDSPLGERTVLADVRQVPAGYRLQISRSGAHVVRSATLRLSGAVTGDELELARQASLLHQRAVALTAVNRGPLIVPLSGGLDSRGILGYLAETRRTDLKTVSFGHAGSLELTYAAELARLIGCPWQAYTLEPSHYQTDFTALYASAGLMSHLMHTHVAAAVSSLPEADRNQVLIGFMGDPVAGAECGHGGVAQSPLAATEHLLASQGYSLPLVRSLFSDTVAEQIQQDVESLFRDCLEKNSPAEFAEYYFCVERQAKLITHVFNSMQTVSGPAGYPYMHGDWARFFHSLHPRHRFGRRLFRRSMAVGLPHLIPVRDTARFTSANARPWRVALAGGRQRVMRRCQSAVEVLSGGRRTLRNPYQTENLPFILNHVLRPVLDRALDELEQRGAIARAFQTRFEGPFFSAKGIHAAFRIISLSQLHGSSARLRAVTAENRHRQELQRTWSIG